jgi:RimJ/RimL family protein N-acetyltransferase
MTLASNSLALARGPRLFLRPLGVNDVNENYLRWMNDPAATRFLESRFQSWTFETLVAFVKADQDSKYTQSLAICTNDEIRHIGNIRVSKFGPPHLNGSVGILIGDSLYRGQGYGVEAISLMCRHAFESLGLQRLTAGCYETNTASIAAFRKSGFREEGRQRGRWVDGNARVDGVILGLTVPDWVMQSSAAR